MIEYTLEDNIRVRDKLNIISYNTRFVACNDGVISSLISQASEQDIPSDAIIDAIDIFIHKNIEKMPRLTEILSEALNQRRRYSTSPDGCKKCGYGGIITMVKDGVEASAHCVCELGKLYAVKYELNNVLDMLDSGYSLSENAKINIGEAGEE